MNALGRALLAGWVMIAAASGCGSSERGPQSATSWLRACTTNDDCTGAPQCLCGVCTIPCEADNVCASAPPGAVCTSLTEVAGCAAAETRGRCTLPVKASMPPSNPTGTCTAPNSGARVGALPGEGDVWLPDCKLKLAREYWRVFVRQTGTAFILPDPLAVQLYVQACAAVQHPLYDIVTRYSFCNPPSTHRPSDEMTPADALAVAHYYHVGSDASAYGLIFGDHPPGILPDPFLTDVMDACKLTTADDSPGLSGLCEQAAALLTLESAGPDAGQNADLIYSGQPGADVAYLLNQLYGIDAPRETWAIDPALCGLPSDSTTCQSMSTRYFYNPVTTECEPRSYGTCGAAPKDFATKEACLGACDLRAKGCRRCDTTGNCAKGDDCSECPLGAPSESSACPNAGLTCTYGSGCSFTTCQCPSDGKGGMTWSCVSTAC